MNLAGFWKLIWTTARRWLEDDVPQLAAAIAFNTVLSLAPMLLLLLTAASRLLGSEAAKGHLLSAVGILAGPDAAPTAERLVDMVVDARGKLLVTALGVLIMVHFSSAVFRQLRSALNRIWSVPPRPGLRHVLYERALSLVVVPAAVLAVMLIMLLGLMGSIAGSTLVAILPQGTWGWGLINAFLSFSLLTLLLAFVFRNGPATEVRWTDVWSGAALTSALLTIGNFFIGHLVGRSLVASLYGAAGALVVVLLWVYYGAQILLFGAHFTRVYSEQHGSRKAAMDGETARAEARG